MKAEAQISEKISLLILEDNPDDVMMYKRRLERHSYDHQFEFQHCETIECAKELVQENTFDAYIVDNNLPDGQGIEFIQYLREKLDPLQPTTIMMITGQGSEELAVSAMKSGVNDYLTKKSISEGYFVRPLLNAVKRAQLSSQVAYYQKELERSNKELSDFTHTASHDLKSPLRRIIAYCEMLLEDAAAKLDDDEKEMLIRMHLNAFRMQTLISDLLMFSLIRTEKEPLAKIDIQKLLEDIQDEMKEQLTENEATLTFDSLPTINAYPIRIKQVFENIISNALKYRSQKPPEINISYLQQDEYHRFEIEDNGMGIDKEFKDFVFKEFKRLHNQETIEGSGLGLPICKKIIEKHEGKIWVESEIDKGSRFIFTIKDFTEL